MKIAIGCIFYNAVKELERLLKSIPDKTFDYFIAIDGIYRYIKEQNPELPDLSTDGSRQLLQNDKIGLTRITKISSLYMDKPNYIEFEKRNKYLEICSEMKDDIDVLIIVDSDEFFLFPEGTKPELAFARFKRNMEMTINKPINKDHNVFSLHTLDVANNYDVHRPRVWYKPGEMRYINGSHYHYANIKTDKEAIETFNKNNINYCQHSSELIKGIVLAHDHSLRSQDQTKIHDQYVEYLKRFEGLTQSHRFTIDEAHELASQGKSYEDVLLELKEKETKRLNE